MALKIHASNVKLTDVLQDYINRHLQFALGRFGTRIRLVKVCIESLNSSKGGMDKRCTIEVSLVRLGKVTTEVTDTSIVKAVNRAADRIAHSVKTSCDRRQAIRIRRRP